jgi:ABC-2 type transport system ATP-binding protein
MMASRWTQVTGSLIFEQVTKRYGSRIALDSLSLQVHPGEIFGFLGPNGAGKSTAIHVAMGFVRPSKGRGVVLGQPFSQSRSARSRIGYVPDAPSFFAHTALDAVLLAARLNQPDSAPTAASLQARALDLLKRFDLPPEGQPVTRFSRGMQQRLAVAQALVLRPELLILDEPTSALDPPGVALVRDALRTARRDGCAVFFSSHQLQEVELLCDRAAFLQEGRLLRLGPLGELLQESQQVRITLRGLDPGGPFEQMHARLIDHDSIARGVPQHPAQCAPPARAGDRTYRMPATEQQAFIESAWLVGAELVSVERERQSLEQLFQHAGRNKTAGYTAAEEREGTR